MGLCLDGFSNRNDSNLVNSLLRFSACFGSKALNKEVVT